MEDCIFCKIVNGDIPCLKLYEDENFISFFDVSPASLGHTLIIPKKHYKNVFELGDTESKNLIFVAKKIATALKQVFNFTDFNLVQNNGPLAGQSVFHFHLHIIPRYENTKNNSTEIKPTEENAKKVFDLLKNL